MLSVDKGTPIPGPGVSSGRAPAPFPPGGGRAVRPRGAPADKKAGAALSRRAEDPRLPAANAPATPVPRPVRRAASYPRKVTRNESIIADISNF